MNQEHILKFEVACSTDKLKNLPKVPLKEVFEGEAPVSIPEKKENPYRWKKEYTYIVAIVVIGLLLMMLMKRRPKPISE